MENNIKIELTTQIVEELQAYSEMLQKSPSRIIVEALELYFENEQEKMQAQNLDMDNGMSNLDYNEFWDDVEI